jgi:stearoyl-CoA desaturase (Delta-9 desaturase)
MPQVHRPVLGGEQIAEDGPQRAPMATDPPSSIPSADRSAGDMRVVEFALVDRIATVTVVAVPTIMLVLGVWFGWGGVLHPSDMIALAITYGLTVVGIGVGFHRLFTHRSFKSGKVIRGALAICGSAAAEGPVIEWVATHRRHHQFSDAEGDPHSPHVGRTASWLGAFKGLFHAHIGWMFGAPVRADESRYAKDLTADPLMRFINRTFVLWVALGLAVPFGLGVALTGTVAGGLTAMLWGGAVRIFLLHHATFSINSLCHCFGRRSFETGDHSRNLAWLAIPTFGEAWHNNHHAFPTSARHGLGRGQIDPSARLIWLLEKAGLAWDVVRVSPERMASKAL